MPARLPKEKIDAVLAHIHANPSASYSDIALACGVSRGTVANLVRKNQIERAPAKAGRPRLHEFQIVQDARQRISEAEQQVAQLSEAVVTLPDCDATRRVADIISALFWKVRDLRRIVERARD